MNKTNVDLISGDGKQRQGSVANILTTMDASVMRPFIGKDGKSYITIHTGGSKNDVKNYKNIQVNSTATLRRDEWKALDEAVLKVSRERLTGVEDLLSRGLTRPLSNAMGTTILESHKASDGMTAEMSMDAVSRSKNDRQTYGIDYLPIPIIHVDYTINQRVLTASRNMGNSIDTGQAESAARRISEKLEDMLFTDTTYKFGGGTIYSYINHPDRNVVSLNKHWDDDSGITGDDILEDVLDMKKASMAKNKYGPWILYIPSDYETVLDQDYDSTRGNTIRERILAVSGIEAIKTADRMPDDNVLLVQMTSDTVRLVDGMPIQNVEWSSQGGMVHNYKVMTIRVPEIRSDDNGQCGIVRLS